MSESLVDSESLSSLSTALISSAELDAIALEKSSSPLVSTSGAKGLNSVTSPLGLNSLLETELPW